MEPAEQTKLEKKEKKDSEILSDDSSESETAKKIRFYEWNEELTKKAEEIISADTTPLKEFWYQKHEQDAKRNWDIFYKNNGNKFFKDRHYIDREFTEILGFTEKSDKDTGIMLEIGCGVGNAIFPLSEKYTNFKFYGFDISPRAIQIIKDSPKYDPERIFVECVDLVKDPFPTHFEKPNIASLIFVLSAISPENFDLVVKKIADFLPKDCVLYFRDYGRYDMAQLKLAAHKKAKLKDNFYVKSDGTRVYYFTTEELKELFEKHGFATIENEYHYRLVENKKEGLKMHRVWIQSKFKRL